jgi:putative membrane protein
VVKASLYPALRSGHPAIMALITPAMGFLRTLFWVAVTVVVVVFSTRNWVPVTISLFGDLQADVKLPVLLMIVFLIGFGPVYLWHHAVRWRDKRRTAAERSGLIQTVPTVEAAPYQAPSPGIEPAQAD